VIERAPLRLAAYAGVLILTFTIAWLAGAWVGPIASPEADQPTHSAGGHPNGDAP
jgi:hypothetical protein